LIETTKSTTLRRMNAGGRMTDQTKLKSIVSWLIAGAQPPKPLDGIVEECARRMNEAQIPVDALAVFGFFIHPKIRGIRVIWTDKKGVRRDTFTREFMESDAFRALPYEALIRDRRILRFSPVDDTPDSASDTIRMYRDAGYTDIIFLPLFNFDGTMNGGIEVATKHKNGFSDDHVTALRRLQAPLARMKEYFTERFDKQITLATYVGEETSRKVLKGNIVLGDGETISAVVMFADIKGFTRLSNTFSSGDVLKVLNRFYAAIGAAVERNNGEILKFLGDGVLVIFPTPDDLTAQEAATGNALEALVQARQLLAGQDEPPVVEFRAALHVGDLFFGNIGSGSRLDFTAIGPTVNLTSRMLEEASARDVETICSTEFQAIAIGQTGTRVQCKFKGFDTSVEVFVLE
jgi:adenylate cyclase